MDKTTQSAPFSSRGNAKRAAENMIRAGTSPAVDYTLKPHDDGRFEIVWKTGAASTTEEVEHELTEAAAQADTGADTREPAGAANGAAEAEEAPTAAPPVPASAVAAEGSEADPFPAGSEVQLRARMVGQISHRVDEHTWAVMVTLSAAELIKPGARTQRARKPAGEPRRSKAADLDEAAARGVMPSKPDVTSHANHHYQKRFDRLAELAAAGDWDAVAGYQCTGVNSYAKMVRQYRDRLVSAHNAQQAAAAQGAAQ